MTPTPIIGQDEREFQHAASPQFILAMIEVMEQMGDTVDRVCEGWTLPDAVRKQLECSIAMYNKLKEGV